MPDQSDYEYLKRWLSKQELKDIRSGNNELGIKLSRQQVYNIMKGTSKNFRFRNILVKQARANELMHG